MTRPVLRWLMALSCSLALALLSTPGLARDIALSFDDAPRADGGWYSGAERTDRLIAALDEVNVSGALFFVTTVHLENQGVDRIAAYASAGHYLANHTHQHAAPERLGLAAYLEDVERADQILRDQPGFLPLFRFPFLNEGRDEAMRDGLRTGLASLGYEQGYVTVDNYDWYMDALLQRALKAGRAVDEEALRALYVSLLVDAADFYDQIARETLGRSPSHVLLLHENDLAARFLPDLVRALRAEGWRIIPGPVAYEDDIASELPDTLFNGQGRVAALAAVQGVPRPQLVHEAESEAWLEARFEAAKVFGPAAEGVDSSR